MKRHLSTTALLLVPTMLGLTGRVLAQDQPPQPKPGVEHRLELLEQKLEQLERRVNAALPPGTDSAPASVSPDRLTALDQKLQLLEENNKQHSELLAKTKDAPVISAGREGFSIASADKAYRLKVGGIRPG